MADKKPGITNYVVLGFFFVQKQGTKWRKQILVDILDAARLLFLIIKFIFKNQKRGK